MTIYEKLQDDLKMYRLAQAKTRVLILSTIIGNIAASAKMVDGVKTVTDEDALAYLKKHMKGLDETAQHLEGDNLAALNDEKSIVSSYLPTQLTAEELYVTFAGRKASGELNSFSEAMKWLKDELPGLYDGKTASTVAREIFNG